MCIIAIQPQGKKISKETLRNCWDNNNDGSGIMYSHNGKIVVQKELYSFKKFMQFKTFADSLNVNIVLHFRISTSAGINLENVHPFKVNENLFFCHNGILNIDVPVNSKINDTQIYNNTILKNLPAKFEQNKGITELLSQSIGNRNKFVFLNSLGEFTIINEHLGTWDTGIWFSNNSYSYNYGYNSYVPKESKKTSKIKVQKKEYTFNWDEFNEWDELKYQPKQCCGSCNEVNELSELIYSNYWGEYLCNECTSLIRE